MEELSIQVEASEFTYNEKHLFLREIQSDRHQGQKAQFEGSEDLKDISTQDLTVLVSDHCGKEISMQKWNSRLPVYCKVLSIAQGASLRFKIVDLKW